MAASDKTLEAYDREIERLQSEIQTQKEHVKRNLHDPVVISRSTPLLRELHMRLDLVKRNRAKAAGPT